MSLKISDKLVLPLTFVTSKQAILAKSRVGKSYTAQVQAEELLKEKQQVLVLDPTSAWWGLRTHADGDKPGYPIAVFGGDHGDLELLPSSGAEMARAAVSEGFNAIFDLSLFDPEEAVTWARAFGDALFKDNRHAMHLFVDEADMFAPERPSTKDEYRCMKTYDRIIRRGGIKGIGCTLICQRSALLNKNVLSQVDMLTVLRMHHPLDLEPVEKWIKVKGDPERGKKMMASLPSLSLGEAWVWNPDADLFKMITIRHKRTFDSGKTPEPGQRTVAPKVLAKVDLARLGAAIAATAERAKENDPAELKAKIAKLERQLAASVVFNDPPTEALDRAYFEGSSAAMVHAQQHVNQFLSDLRGRFDNALALLSQAVPIPSPAAARRPAGDRHEPNGGAFGDGKGGNGRVHRLKRAGELAEGKVVLRAPRPAGAPPIPAFITVAVSKGDLAGPEQNILDSLAWWASLGVHAPQNIQVAYMAGYSPNSKGYKNPRGALNVAGLIEYTGDGALRLTAEGARRARPPQIRPTIVELHASVLERLDNTQQKLLRPLLAVYPDELSNADLAAEANYSPNTKGYKNPRGALRTLGLITYPSPGSVRASDLLFPTGGASS